MALTLKELIEKNKDAYKRHFYIESVYLSHALIVKALKQVIVNEKIPLKNPKIKLGECVKLLKQRYETSPALTKKIKKSVYKNVNDFNADYKAINKELKYQYPEIKLKNAAKRGIDITVALNTILIRLKHNS